MQDTCSAGYTSGVVVRRLPEGALQHELTKVEQLHDPPVPVWAWLPLDSREWAGELSGWAAGSRFVAREPAPDLDAVAVVRGHVTSRQSP